MYRSCIFCSADLGANTSIEAFPVGRSLAFDGNKGRLWAVCPRCARWNLAPIEERWEAMEDAERLFRDTRTRVQNENVGLARLRDGTRLIRVGAALAGELAAWRYGNALVRRGMRYRWRVLVPDFLVPRMATVSMLLGPLGLLAGGATSLVYESLRTRTARRTASVPLHLGAGVVIRRKDIVGAYLEPGQDGPVRLHLPTAEGEWATLDGADATSVLARGLVGLNVAGASRKQLDAATALLAGTSSPAALLEEAARRNVGFGWSTAQMHWNTNWGPRHWIHRAERQGIPRHRVLMWQRVMESRTASGGSPLSLALEMALHEETERRAMEGELSALEEMWRQAEEIASIADRLPEDVPASAPARPA